MTSIRIISTLLFILLILVILFSFAYLDSGPVKAVTSEGEMIKKKYGSQVIQISQQIDTTGKTIVRFAAFKSLLKIGNEIEQPIFLYENAI